MLTPEEKAARKRARKATKAQKRLDNWLKNNPDSTPPQLYTPDENGYYSHDPDLQSCLTTCLAKVETDGYVVVPISYIAGKRQIKPFTHSEILFLFYAIPNNN